jgi:cation diffusion facilitator CzcD-associated flavoprotein CzcO
LAVPEERPAQHVDVVIVGAGILGINQLYRAVQAGYSAQLLEQADGVGGTWYWNRYPGCRFDSESYTYGYLFSEELWQDWDWSEERSSPPSRRPSGTSTTWSTGSTCAAASG